MSPSLAFVDGADPDLHRTVLEGVRAYNATLFAGHPAGRDLAIAIRDS